MFPTDFLDITMKLRNNTVQPFKTTLYLNIYKQFKHPKAMRKAIDPMTNNLLNKLSSNKNMYDILKKIL